MTDPIGKLDINNIDPKEDIRMTGQDLINLLAGARIDENQAALLSGCIKPDREVAIEARFKELKSLIKEG